MAITGAHTARMVYTNHIIADPTTLSANTAVTTLPVSNLKHRSKSKVWRSVGLTTAAEGETVTFDFTVPKAVQQVVIINHNLSALATVTVLGATNSAFSPAAVNVTGLTVNREFKLVLHRFSSEQSYQHWRFKFEDNTNSDGYVEFGFGMLGPSIDFDHRPGFRLPPIDPSVRRYSFDGQKSVYKRTKYRMVEFLIGDEQDMSKLQRLYDDVGTSEDFLLMLDPSGNTFDNITDGLYRFTLYGTINDLDLLHKIKGVVDVPIVFEEGR